VLQYAKEEKNILPTANEVRLMALRRNCHIHHVIAGKLETGKRGRRSKQLLNVLKETRKLKEKAADGNLWRIRFGTGCGPVVRQTTEL
jgi:hypothetical protein